MATLPDLSKIDANTRKALEAVFAAQAAENAKLKAKAAAGSTIRFKVSEKGALSVYGLSARFPTTLYIGQWERLWANLDALKAFAEANSDALKRKED